MSSEVVELKRLNRRGVVMEFLGLTDWGMRELEGAGLRAWGWSDGGVLVPWSELSAERKRVQRKFYRRVDVLRAGGVSVV